MNITFFKGNKVFNIFSSNIFSKKATFSKKNAERKFLEAMTIFDEAGSSYVKNEYNLFYHKLNAKYFYVNLFFSQKAIFSQETAKYYFGSAFNHFLGKRGVPRK